jgi:hypothetical protein
MATTREQFFVCTLTTRDRTITRPIRAWDGREAAQLFRDILKEEGCWSRGRVAIDPMVRRPTPSTALEAVRPG